MPVACEDYDQRMNDPAPVIRQWAWKIDVELDSLELSEEQKVQVLEELSLALKALSQKRRERELP